MFPHLRLAPAGPEAPVSAPGSSEDHATLEQEDRDMKAEVLKAMSPTEKGSLDAEKAQKLAMSREKERVRKAEWARKDREKKKRMAAELKAAQDAAIEMASEAMAAQAQLDQLLKQLLKQRYKRISKMTQPF